MAERLLIMYCPACAGSGEGYCPGVRCSECKGIGEISTYVDEETSNNEEE